MMQKRIRYVTEEDEEKRIDKFLAETEENLSRSLIQKLIKEEKVLVNKTAVKARYEVKPGDEIILIIPDLTEPEALPEKIPLDILYEDKDIIIVNKPKGMVVHPAAGHYSGTLVNALLFHCQKELSGINGVMRPGIVHRIDKDTTGVLVVCKNDAAHASLAEQLKKHSITRIYYAVVCGELTEDGTINAPIGRHPSERKKMAVCVKNGKNAVTHYHVLAYKNGYSFIECQLETGRTHQIRVHMASIHHPVLGDTVYGRVRENYSYLEGQTLHAGVLGFSHPSTGEYMEFRAPLPEYFQKLLKQLQLEQ